MSPRTFSASEEEVQLVNRILDMVNHGKATTLDVDSATTIFTTRGVSLAQLREVWALADRGNKGHLTKGELAVVIRLVGWIQSGRRVAEELITKPGPLPTLRGITDFISRKLPVPGPSPLSLRISSITPKEQPIGTAFQFNHNETFKQAFLQADPVNGLVDREQVLEIFISKFSISFHYLAQIFELIDLSGRNALDIQEFCLGMHILEAFDSNSRLVLPVTIPIDIRDQLIHLQSLLSQNGLPLSNRSSPQHTASSHGEGSLSAIEEDINLIKDQLSQRGLIYGELLNKLRLRYHVQPVEVAQIWNSTPGYDSVPVSPATIEAAVQRIRRRLTLPVPSPIQSPSPSIPMQRSAMPDFSNLPQRLASPVSSEYSYSTDTTGSVSGVPEIKPFIIAPIEDEDEEWDLTDSSTTSSAKWSRRPPASYSGSCRSSSPIKLRSPRQYNPPISLRKSSDVPAGNQYFTEEMQLLRAQLQDMQQRMSGTISVDKQSRLQHHFTDEIDRLTIALAQRDVQYEASQALLLQYRATADKLEEERDNLRQILDPQVKENAEIKTELEQAKHDLQEFTSVNSAPTMRILFLRASLRQSQEEVAQAKLGVATLQKLVAGQKAELAELHAAKQVVQHVRKDSLVPGDQVLETLGVQVQEMRQLMEQFMTFIEANSASFNIMKGQNEKYFGQRDVTLAAPKHALKPGDIITYDDIFPTPNPITEAEPEPDLDWGNVAASWCKTLTTDKDSKAEVSSPGSQRYSLLTPPESPEPPHRLLTSRRRVPEVQPVPAPSTVGSSSAPQRETSPLYIAKKRHPTLSSSKLHLEYPMSAYPPVYATDPANSDSYAPHGKHLLHRQALKTSLVPYTKSSTTQDSNNLPRQSKETDKAGYSDFYVRPDAMALYVQAKEASRIVQSSAYCASPTSIIPDDITRKQREKVDMDTNPQDEDSEEPTTQPRFRNSTLPRPSRKETSSKSNRLHEWYEQEIGRLMARCENAQKLAEKARGEEQRHCELAYTYQDAVMNAMGDVDNLREMVRAQRTRIAELSGLLGGHPNLIINNPDNFTMAAEEYEEALHSATDPPSYDQALDIELTAAKIDYQMDKKA